MIEFKNLRSTAYQNSRRIPCNFSLTHNANVIGSTRSTLIGNEHSSLRNSIEGGTLSIGE
jgi:hypothetical protein